MVMKVSSSSGTCSIRVWVDTVSLRTSFSVIASRSQLWTFGDMVNNPSGDRVTRGACIDLLYTLMTVHGFWTGVT
jgi:hypothetical protein